MIEDGFSKPVYVTKTIGTRIDIRSACEALAFLETFPTEAAENSRVFARDICRSVIDGLSDPDEGRVAFEQFARSAGIYIEQTSASAKVAEIA